MVGTALHFVVIILPTEGRRRCQETLSRGEGNVNAAWTIIENKLSCFRMDLQRTLSMPAAVEAPNFVPAPTSTVLTPSYSPGGHA